MTFTTSRVDEHAHDTELSKPRFRSKSRRRTRRRLVLVGIVLAGAAGFLIDKVLTSAIVYFETAQQAIAHRAVLGDSTFQIEGIVVPGSLHRTSTQAQRFSISSGPVTVAVENTGTPSSLFAQNVPVVLVGHFVGSSNVFSSNEILVKHSNQYIAAHPSRVRAPNGSVR